MDELFFLHNLLLTPLFAAGDCNFGRICLSLLRKIQSIIRGIKEGCPTDGVEVTLETPSGQKVKRWELSKEELVTIRPKSFFQFKEGLPQGEIELLRLLLEEEFGKIKKERRPPQSAEEERVFLKGLFKREKELENLGEEWRDAFMFLEYEKGDKEWVEEATKSVTDPERFEKFYETRLLPGLRSDDEVYNEDSRMWVIGKKFLRRLNKMVPKSKGTYVRLHSELKTIKEKSKDK